MKCKHEYSDTPIRKVTYEDYSLREGFELKQGESAIFRVLTNAAVQDKSLAKLLNNMAVLTYECKKCQDHSTEIKLLQKDEEKSKYIKWSCGPYTFFGIKMRNNLVCAWAEDCPQTEPTVATLSEDIEYIQIEYEEFVDLISKESTVNYVNMNKGMVSIESNFHLKGSVSCVDNKLAFSGKSVVDNIGVQIDHNGKIWVCVNGMSFLRYQPLTESMEKALLSK
jgi:hypothetical protein